MVLEKIEVEVDGVPVSLIRTDTTIAWRMDKAVNGQRYGNWYPGGELDRDFLVSEARKAIRRLAGEA